jgi:hypothetical protein
MNIEVIQGKSISIRSHTVLEIKDPHLIGLFNNLSSQNQISYLRGGHMNQTRKKRQKDIHLDGPRFLPLKKAAEYLGLTVWAMRERIWAGQIPVAQFPGGRKMYVDIRDIEDFIKKNKKVIV